MYIYTSRHFLIKTFFFTLVKINYEKCLTTTAYPMSTTLQLSMYLSGFHTQKKTGSGCLDKTIICTDRAIFFQFI